MPRLRHRRAALFATLVAVALGAALASACGGLFETALRLDAPPQRLAAYDAVVAPAEHATLAAGDGRPAQQVTLSERGHLPAGTLEAVRATPGVTDAHLVPDLGAIAVRTTDPTALHTAGMQAASTSHTGVRPRYASRMQAGGSQGVTVLTGDQRGRAEAVGVAGARIKLVLLSSIFGGLALIVMAILLASIIGLSVEQRQRELALLRTIGATPKQVRRLVVGATVRPAVIAAVAGAAAGPFLARVLFDRIQAGGVVPDVLALRQSGIGVAVGALGALLITRVAAGLAARKAAKARLGEALGEAEELPGTLGPVRRIAAAVCVAGAVSCGSITLFMSPENAAATGGGTALAGALACALVAPRLIETARGEGALHGVPRPARRAQRASPRAPQRRARDPRDPRRLGRAGQRLPADDAGERGRARPRPGRRGRREHDHRAPAGSSTPSIARIASTRGRCSPPTASRTSSSPATASRSPTRSTRSVGDTIGMVLGDGAHVRLKVAKVLDGSSRNRSILLPDRVCSGPTRARRPSPTRRRSTSGSRSPSSA